MNSLARNAAAIFVVLASGITLAACGSDESDRETASTTPGAAERIWPKPAETPEQAVARLASAVRSGDCSDAEEIFHGGNATETCDEVLPDLEPEAPDSFRAYGSGVVVDAEDGRAVILALDRDGRYRFATSFSSKPPEVPTERAEETMTYAVGAIRRENCEELKSVALVFLKGDRYCTRRPVRELRRALTRDYSASPVLLGGDGSVAFYGLRAKPGAYFTLLFVGHENDGYAYVDSYRAR